MEDNNFLENIDFSENFLTQDKMKCELVLPTQCDSSVDSNETSVKHTTTRNCFSKIVQNPYTNGNKYNSPAFINPEIMKNTCSEKLPVTSTTGYTVVMLVKNHRIPTIVIHLLQIQTYKTL